MKLFTWMLALTFTGCTLFAATHSTELNSPNKEIKVKIYQKEISANNRQIYYEVFFRDQQVILESALDIRLDNHLSENALALKVPKVEKFCQTLVIDEIIRDSSNMIWKPICGERSSIPQVYNQVTLKTYREDFPDYKINFEIRAYNEGIAIRYCFPENKTGVYYRVTEENTEFKMPEGTEAWVTTWAQGPYEKLDLKQWPDIAERPLTLVQPNGTYLSLAEANLSDYPLCRYTLSNFKTNTVVTKMYSDANCISPFNTPWRVILIAGNQNKLLENNYLLLNLSEPNKILNTDWIKPGKIIRETTLTTTNAKACIDFAAEHGLQYILFDYKWYGPAMTFESDASTVEVDIDMPGVVSYGKSKGIGVWLYVNQQALLKQKDQIFPLYKEWGIKGIKFGFVNIGAQQWTAWLEDAIKTAAENELMVNIHDEYRPTGTYRTWPNVLTVEGIRGNEEFPDATHNTILPYTRMIAGAGDYTVCYYDKRIKTTHAHQLALPVILYSPLQTLFWYDKPSAYEGEPEIEFFENVPVTWDETRVLQGAPGEYIVIARRKGNDWFVGVITNNDSREITLDFNFLVPDLKYTAKTYFDDPKAKTKTKVGVKKTKISNKSKEQYNLKPSGGLAIWIKAENK